MDRRDRRSPPRPAPPAGGDAASPRSGAPQERAETVSPLRLRRDLEARGLPAELASRTAERLAGLAAGLRGEDYESLLSALAFARGATGAAPARGADELAEVERLAEGLARELRKVDEGLRTLGAFVERLRSRTPAPPDATLH